MRNQILFASAPLLLSLACIAPAKAEVLCPNLATQVKIGSPSLTAINSATCGTGDGENIALTTSSDLAFLQWVPGITLGSLTSLSASVNTTTTAIPELLVEFVATDAGIAGNLIAATYTGSSITPGGTTVTLNPALSHLDIYDVTTSTDLTAAVTASVGHAPVLDTFITNDSNANLTVGVGIQSVVGGSSQTLQVSSVDVETPEPAAFTLAAAGLGLLTFFRRRRT